MSLRHRFPLFVGILAVALTACVGTASSPSPSESASPSQPPAPARSASPAPTAQGRILPDDCGAGLVYVALGDSTVLGVGASSPQINYVSRLFTRLRAAYPKAQVTNLGVGGATSADVVRDQLPGALALHPRLVTISVGPNDITQLRGVGEFAQNMDGLFLTLTRDTLAAVVMNLLPDLAVSPRFSGDERVLAGRQTVLFNDALQAAARRYGLQLVDLYTASQQDIPTHPEYVSADRYHPSDAGYARWAELFWRGVEARIPPACRAP